MAKAKKHTGLRRHLQDAGVLESGDSEMIAKVTAAYWCNYHKEYKRERRETDKEYVVALSKAERRVIEREAAAHSQSLTAFIKASAWAYVHQAFLQPDKAQMARIGQVLSLCYSSIETLMASEKYDPHELDKALRIIIDIEGKLEVLSTAPENLERTVKKVLNEKPHYIITLKKLIEDYDHKEQGEEEHKVGKATV